MKITFSIPNLSKFYHHHFNWKTYTISLQENNKMIARIILVNTSRAWVSLPYFSYGGYDCAADHDITLPEINKIISYIISNALPPDAHHLNIDELVKTKPHKNIKYFIRGLHHQGHDQKSSKICSLIHLPGEIDELWADLNSNLRRKINKAKSNGLIVKQGGLNLLNDFYKVYYNNIKRLKSVSYSKSFFYDLIKFAPAGTVKIFVVYMDEEAIGAALLLSNRGFHENAFFASNLQYKRSYVSDYLHWSMLKSIYDEKQSDETLTYSFGRSTINSSVHKYKSHWPVSDYPLYIDTNISYTSNSTLLRKGLAIIPSPLRMFIGKHAIKHIY